MKPIIKKNLLSSASVGKIQTQVNKLMPNFQTIISNIFHLQGFSMTSESQGPLDFASTQLMASEDSNSLYEPGVKRIKTE